MQMRKELKALIFVFILGLAYACLVRYTSFCIPCFFNTITGLKCPGCGITHVFLSLMKFDLHGAYLANPFLLISSPILIVIIVLNFFCSKKIRTSSFTKWLTLRNSYPDMGSSPKFSMLNHSPYMPVHMTANIDRYRHPGNVGRVCFYIYSKSSHAPSESARPDSELVYFL